MISGRSAILLLAAIISVTLTGCFTKDYGQSDIEEFLEEQGIENYKVSENYYEQEGEDGYTDQIWEVTAPAPDGAGELQFHVIDDYAWRGEALSNVLGTDYEAALLIYLADKYDDFEQLHLVKWEDGAILHAYLSCPYENRLDLQSGYDDVLAFQHFVTDSAGDIGYKQEEVFTVEFQMQSPLRNTVAPEGSNYEMDDGDFRMRVTSADESQLLSGERRFIRTCADYRFEDLLSDFSEEEIEAALSEGNYRIGIHEENMEEGTYRTMPGLSASNFGYGISYGCLYRILSEWGQTPQGDLWHYSFVGADGSEYEISYDFHQYNEEEPEQESYYYYMKDGEIIWMDYFFYNHFTLAEVKEMTGLELAIGNLN